MIPHVADITIPSQGTCRSRSGAFDHITGSSSADKVFPVVMETVCGFKCSNLHLKPCYLYRGQCWSFGWSINLVQTEILIQFWQFRHPRMTFGIHWLLHHQQIDIFDWMDYHKISDIDGAPRINLITLVISWLFLLRHQQVKVFTHPVKYLNIHQMGWHNLLYRHSYFMLRSSPDFPATLRV